MLWGKPQASLPAPSQGGKELPPVPGLPNGEVLSQHSLLLTLSVLR